jgi:hypothetical protein
MRLNFLWIATCPLAADGPDILARRCTSCHNEQARMGGLNLTTREAAAGALAGKVLARVEKGERPSGAPLPAAEREALRQWGAAGAPWKDAVKVVVRPQARRDWWSLQPLPNTEGSIDGFIDAALAAKGLRRNPPAGLSGACAMCSSTVPRVAADAATVHGFWATVLHWLGLDHERLTWYHNGLNRRLTGGHGHVLKSLLA